jgi:hypothetical protein
MVWGGGGVKVFDLGCEFGVPGEPAPLAAAVVGQHSPGHAVQPELAGLTLRELAHPPPGDHIGLGHDVGGVLG